MCIRSNIFYHYMGYLLLFNLFWYKKYVLILMISLPDLRGSVCNIDIKTKQPFLMQYNQDFLHVFSNNSIV